MSRIKTGLLFLLCLCLAGTSALSESPNLLSGESIQADEVNYRTTEVELGTYERRVGMQASEHYPRVASLRYEGSKAKFVEYKIKRNDEVKAGDVLAVFSTEIDEVELAALRVELEQLQSKYDSGRLEKMEEIENLTEQLRDVTEQYARELLMLQISRAELLLEQYDYQQQLAIADVRKAIAEMEEEAAGNVLVAPFDGVITSTHYMREGDRVPTNEVLLTIQSMDHVLLRVSNPQGEYRYGMDVKIEIGASKARYTLSGRVVGADTQLPASQRSGYAYIAIDDYSAEEIQEAKKTIITNPSVSGATRYLENVVLVPRRAVKLDNGKYVVNKLVGTTLHKRYVNFIMQNASHAWVIQGLEPGETIIID